MLDLFGGVAQKDNPGHSWFVARFAFLLCAICGWMVERCLLLVVCLFVLVVAF